ncbi:MAG: hypothetical protein RLZZ387_1161 [Chloroflexota bacterium]|jgi:SAM-dependent methyltransferase
MIKVGHELSDAEIARRYSQLAGGLALPAYFYPAVAAFTAAVPAGRILDLGCGNGDLLLALASGNPAAPLVGAEVSADRARLAARRLGPRASLAQVDGGGRLPFADGSFDRVFLTEVLEHLKDPVALLREVRRLLAPGGRLVLTAPNSDAYPLWPALAWLSDRTGRPELLMHFVPFEHPIKTRQPIDTLIAHREIVALLAEAGLVPARVAGREALPFLFALPGFRGLAFRTPWLRPLLDRLVNRAGMLHACYRVFYEVRRDDDDG